MENSKDVSIKYFFSKLRMSSTYTHHTHIYLSIPYSMAKSNFLHKKKQFSFLVFAGDRCILLHSSSSLLHLPIHCVHLKSWCQIYSILSLVRSLLLYAVLDSKNCWALNFSLSLSLSLSHFIPLLKVTNIDPTLMNVFIFLVVCKYCSPNFFLPLLIFT
jgi:hypothetical protein